MSVQTSLEDAVIDARTASYESLMKMDDWMNEII